MPFLPSGLRRRGPGGLPGDCFVAGVVVRSVSRGAQDSSNKPLAGAAGRVRMGEAVGVRTGVLRLERAGVVGDLQGVYESAGGGAGVVVGA